MCKPRTCAAAAPQAPRAADLNRDGALCPAPEWDEAGDPRRAARPIRDTDFALSLSVFKHTSPQQFGKVMAMTKPRLAVGYNFYNDHDTLPVMLEQVRRTYDGPLAMATDYMVFNVTKEAIRVRMAAVDTEIWPTHPTRPKSRDPGARDTFSEFTKSGKDPMSELIQQIYEDFNLENGTNVPVPGK